MANYTDDASLRPYEPIDDWRPRSVLNGAISAEATSIMLKAVDRFPDVCSVIVGSEEMSVTGRDLTAKTLTVSRGTNSTTAATHADGATVTMASFDFSHVEAKRRIDEDLTQRGIDILWERDNAPKPFSPTVDFRTPSAYYALYTICQRQSSDPNGVYQTKTNWYLKKYSEAMAALKPRLIVCSRNLATWYHSGTAWTDITILANVQDEGAPIALMDTADAAVYCGLGDVFTVVNVLMSTKGEYSDLIGEYWNGTAWATLTLVDGTDKLTNIKTNDSITWAAPADWAPYTISGGVDSRSRYWVRFRSSAVTTQGRAWYFQHESVFVQAQNVETMGSGLVGLA